MTEHESMGINLEHETLLHANNVTLNSYNNRVDEYIEGSPSELAGSMKAWLDQTFSDVPTSAKVLELGSAGGRDASYLEAQGYQVERTDASEAFVDRLREQGHSAEQLNVLTDNIDENYDVIFANAVFLHFSKEQAGAAIEKVHDALNPGGKFALTLKPGEGEGWSSEKLEAPRWFSYWNDQEIEEKLQAAGFAKLESVPDERGWLQYIAQKVE